MTVEWTSDPRAFTTRDWTTLVQADPDGTLFHTPRYLKLYWEEFGATDLQISVVREGEETLAAAAFDLRKGRLSFLGGSEVTDYMGPVGPAPSRDRAAKELIGAIATRDDWRSADLRGLPQDGGWLGALVAGAGAAGLDVRVEQDAVAPFLPLPPTYDGYLEALPSKRRHELRRKVRRLRESMPDARLVEATEESLAEDLDTFVKLHRSSGGPKGRFMQPGMELFFRRLGEAWISDGVFRLVFLEAGGQRVAAAVGFRDRDRLLLYNSAYAAAHAAVSPGIVLVTELIRDSIEEGRRGVDMLKGNLRYKYQFGATPRHVCRLLLRR